MQVVATCRALFSDWKALNMACDVPAALIARLQQQAAWKDEALTADDRELADPPVAADDGLNATQKPPTRRRERGDALQRGACC